MLRSIRALLPLALTAFALLPPAPAQQKAGKQPQRLGVVTYIDVYPNFAADSLKLLQRFAADSRKDAGAVRVELFQDVARSNHFTLVEVWQTRQAFDAHSALPHTRELREKLSPMIGAPFDERLYTIVE
jgi:quinol monooxygenase YgiN